MDLVTVDIFLGLPTAKDGFKYMLVDVDFYTKWIETYNLLDQKAATCITALYNGFFSRFGLARQLHSDQGRNFEAALVKKTLLFNRHLQNANYTVLPPVRRPNGTR